VIQIKKLFLFLFIIGMSISLISNYAYAESEKNNVSWKLTFLADKQKCNFLEETKTKEIENIVKKYFELYKLSNNLLEMNCVSSQQYFNSINSDDTDLNIIVFDKVIGKQIMMKHGYEGFYAHYGTNRMNHHVIMVSTQPPFSSAYDNTEFSWLLSHELSHFILSYKGHNVDSIERMLHANKLQYEDCISDVTERCSQVKAIISSNVSGQKFNVMAPLKDVVNQNSMSYFSDDLYSSNVVKKVLHQITEWWINGVINDEDYLMLLQQIVDVPVNNNQVVKTTQLSISNGFSILDETKDQKKIEKTGIEPTNTKIYDILRFVPFDTYSIKLELNDSKIPSWYKTRAILWHNNHLEDRVFFDGIDAIVREGLIQKK
jgi:hypothetical protein